MVRTIWISALLLAAVARGYFDPRLAAAAQGRDIAALRSLLTQGASVNDVQPDGSSALLWAVHWGDLESVKLLLAAGAKPGMANRYGITPLAEACALGNASIASRLIKAGADPISAYRDGGTPLMAAARSGSVELVGLLLDQGAKVNVTDDLEGQSALMRAVQEGHSAVVKLLLDRGASVNLAGRVTRIPHRGTPDVHAYAQVLRGGMTALMFAARDGRVDILQILLDAKADVNLRDPDDVSPLMVAVMNTHLDAAKLLVEHGADSNDGSLYALVDTHNMPYPEAPPLPVLTGSLSWAELAGLLMDHGADPNRLQTTKLPFRGLMRSQQGQSPPPGMTPLHRAVMAADVELVKVLLAHGADINVPARQGSTLFLALSGTRPETLVFRDEPSTEERLTVIRAVLEKKADVNAPMGSGDTPLHLAVLSGKVELVDLLVSHGARVDVKNRSGFTPLDLALGKQPRRTLGGEAPGIAYPDIANLLQSTAVGGRSAP